MKLYAYRPDSNPSFMIACDTEYGAAAVLEAWIESVEGRGNKASKDFKPEDYGFELITLEVEEESL